MSVAEMILHLSHVRKQILDGPRVTLVEHVTALVNWHADLSSEQFVVWRRACHCAEEPECRFNKRVRKSLCGHEYVVTRHRAPNRDNGSDHRAGTIDHSFLNHAQVRLRVHHIVITRLQALRSI